MFKFKIQISLLILLSVMFTLNAYAEKKKTAQEILKIVDANLTDVDDTTYTAEVSVIRNKKTIKSMKFEAILKGLVQKKIKFLAPGDIRGVTIMTNKDGLMYVYMPSYKRVRRVASHVRNQGFMGTDVSAEEMGTASLSSGWKAKITSENDKDWVLELKPNSSTETIYAKMDVTVSKKYKGVTQIKSYDKSGKLLKTQKRSKFKTYDAVTIPTRFEYFDHNTGSKTVMTFSGCLVNKGIPDSLFTKRSLMRGQ